MGDYSMSFVNVYEITENTLVEIYNFYMCIANIV
jgi:hypothetical protein